MLDSSMTFQLFSNPSSLPPHKHAHTGTHTSTRVHARTRTIMRPLSRPRPPLPSSMPSRQPLLSHSSVFYPNLHSWVEALPLPMGGCPAPPSSTPSRPTTLLPRACSNLKHHQLGPHRPTHPSSLAATSQTMHARAASPGPQLEEASQSSVRRGREPGGAQRSERTSPNKLDSATALLQSQTRAAPLSRGGRLIHGIKLELEQETA